MRFRTFLLSASTFALATPAYAQAVTQSPDVSATTQTAPVIGGNNESPSQEIVVTASKSGAQTLQKAPLAIQSFSGESLKEKNVNNITDLVGGIPGASVGQSTSSIAQSYNIRGVGVSGTNGDSPIGYYLDDVPFVIPNFGIAPPIRFVDLDRVEVLRGPQGTLYGQGSEGGTMIFHTRDPDLNKFLFTGEVSSSSTRGAGGLNYGASGAVSIPIVQDHLAIRLSAGYDKNQGYADVFYGAPTGTPNEKNANFSSNRDLRAVVLWKPASNIKIRGQIWQFQPKQGYDSLLFSTKPPYFANTGGVQGYSRGKFTIYSLSEGIDLGPISISNVTSYLKGDFGSNIPLGGGVAFATFFFPKNFSDEFRVNSNGSSPLHYVIGAQYNDGQGPQSNIFSIPSTGTVIQNANNNAKTKNEAVFGEISYDLFGGKVVPLGGIRYYHDVRTYVEGATSIPSTRNVVTWRANLSYIPNANLTAFFTASTGFRAGIIQSSLQATSLQADGVPAQTSLNPERLTNYEIGTKWRGFDRTLSVGLNLYRIDFTNVQTSIAASNGIGGYVNLGSAHTNGIDLSIDWRTPIKGLTLNAVGNVNNGSFDEVGAAIQAALPTVRPGGRLLNSVRHNYQVAGNYDAKLTEALDLFANASVTGFGNRLMSGGQVVKSYELVGAALGVRRGPYELAITAENLTDERGPNYIFLQGFESGPTPRTVGLRFRVNYK